MKVLITGGAGFVGSNLAHHLVARGCHVRVLDNLSAGQIEPQLPDAAELIVGDFTDRSTMGASLQGVDAVVHLAALSGVMDSVVDPAPSFEINVVGTFQLLQLAHQAGVGRLINASTGGALLGEVTPPISESMAPCPLSPYGASKMAVEGYCSAFSGSYGLPCTTLRFSNLYGPRSAHKKSVVAAFIKLMVRGAPLVVYGNGSQQRDYLFVGDLVFGIEQALRTTETGVFQLGSGRPTTLNRLIEALSNVSGQRAKVQYEPVRRGEVHTTWCDISKARRELGFDPATSLEHGLAATWQWFIANRDVWTDDAALTSSD
jgi:UDP-glucose 4-epimerase